MATPAAVKYIARISLRDHAGKPSFITFEVSSAAYAAWLTDTTAGAVRTTFDAYEALTLDTVEEESVSAKAYVTGATGLPSSENAVNSAKLLILTQDAVNGEKSSNSIPARNAANFTSARGQVLISGGTTQINALVTQITANQRSDDGNGVLVREIRVVGRGTAA